MITKIDEAGKYFIRKKEGLRLVAYADGDYYAIGYGNMFYENERRVQKNDTITKDRAIEISDFWFSYFARNVRALVTSNVNQSQFNALVSYAYNRGINAFRKSNLLKMVNSDPRDSNIRKQFEVEWGTNLNAKKGLIIRRKEEAEMYFNQSYNYNFGLLFILFLLLISVLIYVNTRKNK